MNKKPEDSYFRSKEQAKGYAQYVHESGYSYRLIKAPLVARRLTKVEWEVVVGKKK